MPAKDTTDSLRGPYLLASARQAIAQRLEVDMLRKEQPDDPFFSEKRPLFVTLKKKGALRGCIGTLQAVGAVADEVRRLAVGAAFHDNRFSPLTPEELDEIKISVSVLSASTPLDFTDSHDLLSRLRPGLDGVTIKKSGHSATFLPQVWQQLPRPEEFLSQLCLKAGLPADTWHNPGLEVEIYQVTSYGENT